MSTFSFRLPAADGTKFAPGCLDSQIGAEFPLTVLGIQAASPLTLVSYEVSEDGSWAELTVETGVVGKSSGHTATDIEPGDDGTDRKGER